MKPYQSVAHEGVFEQTLQKSRFIGLVTGVQDEEAALSFIASAKQRYTGASTYAHAYILGSNVQRFFDDGEPSGTAGMPMLEVLKQKNLFYTAAVVVRYFGGILLGAGGLTRAFASTCNGAVTQGEIAFWHPTYTYHLAVPYGAWGKVSYALAHSPYRLLSSQFSEQVSVTVEVKEADNLQFLADAAGWLQGEMSPSAEVHYAVWP